jgi:hypothetical protein
VGSVALPISREALAEAQKHSIPIQALLGKGSGERGRVNYFDVHRIVHPPTFRCKALAEAEKTHLKGNVLDKIFEKSYGSGAAPPPKPASTTSDKKATQPAAKEGKDAAKTAPVAPAEPKGVTAGFLLPTKKGPFRKPGQVDNVVNAGSEVEGDSHHCSPKAADRAALHLDQADSSLPLDHQDQR